MMNDLSFFLCVFDEMILFLKMLILEEEEVDNLCNEQNKKCKKVYCVTNILHFLGLCINHHAPPLPQKLTLK